MQHANQATAIALITMQIEAKLSVHEFFLVLLFYEVKKNAANNDSWENI